MLVLTRKVGQRIMIGNDVEITVTKIQGGRVKVGVTAPRNVSVIRVELPKPVERSPAQLTCEDPTVSW
jgi:carbon storage regulator